MNLKVKLVAKCPKNRRGEFIIKSKNESEIRISRKLNINVAEFAETLLHELLHFWCAILQTHGLAEPKRKEHQFIYRAVQKVINIYNLIFRK